MHAVPLAVTWEDHGLAAVLAGLALLLAGLSFLLRAGPLRPASWRWLAAVLASVALGAGLVPAAWGFWLAAGGAGLLVSLVVLLLFSGSWSREAALALVGVTLVGLGSLAAQPAAGLLEDAAYGLAGLRFKEPLRLTLLALLPVVVWLGWKRLRRGEGRPYVALGLRCLLLTALVLALAEPFLSLPNRNLTVLFVLDRSLSVAEELGDDPAQPGSRVDLRWARVRKFINESVQKRGPGHTRDRAGLVVFGKRPRLDLPPSDAPRFNLVELPAIDDGTYSDLGAALKLALASFPEGTARRIVLLTDGNENLGNAEEQVRLAKTLGVQVDVVPLGAGQINEDEVLVERVDAPPVIETGAVVPVRVLVRSHCPDVVVGRLTLRQITDKEARVNVVLGPGGDTGLELGPPADDLLPVTAVRPNSPGARAGVEVGEQVRQVDGKDVASREAFAAALKGRPAGATVTLTLERTRTRIVDRREGVKLRYGLNPFSFDRPQREDQRSYSYEAVFEPTRVEDARGGLLRDRPAADRVQNNRAAAHVVARGRGRVLLLEQKAGEHRELVRRLERQGKGQVAVVAEPVEVLDAFKDRDKLAVFLSNFDCVILANVPRERISDEQQEVIRANTHDQGCGLVMIGGPDGFGAGGWQNTPVEKALPVDCDIKSLKMSGQGGLAMIMHACEMAQGNSWEKKIAKLAIERLGPNDHIGVIDFGGVCKWHIDFQEVGNNKPRLLAKLDSMVPGDMPDFDPALQLAFDALTDPKKDLATRHIIIISDGDPQQLNKGLLQSIRDRKITITAVGVATHGAPQDQALAAIASPKTAADLARGLLKGEDPKRKYYKVDDPRQLPAIYTREARLVSQSFVYKKLFQPELTRTGPVSGLRRVLPLGGFVRTTAKPDRLVETPILTPKMADQEFPVLAYWHYGLGKSVAFTSDAGDPDFWSRPWIEGEGDRDGIFAQFWEAVIAYALRPVESGRLQMLTEYRDGKIKVTVDARTKDGKPDNSLRLRAGITTPGKGGGAGGPAGTKQQTLRFVQKNSGQYEAELKADEAGSYFVTAQATRVRRVKTRDGKEEEVEDEGVDSVRAGVTLPYSPEFSELEANTPLLDRLAELSAGRKYDDDPASLAEAARLGEVYRPVPEATRRAVPVFHWLLFLAGGLLLADVASRRLAFDTDALADHLARSWARLRGRPLPPPPEQPAARLRPRRLGEAPAGGDPRAGRRFEAGAPGGAPAFADAAAPARPAPGPKEGAPAGPARSTPQPPEAPAPNYADRLLAAKRRALEDRDGKKNDGPDR